MAQEAAASEAALLAAEAVAEVFQAEEEAVTARWMPEKSLPGSLTDKYDIKKAVGVIIPTALAVYM